MPLAQFTLGSGVRRAGSDLGVFASFTALPVATDGDIAYIPQLVGTELVRMRYVAADSAWEVEPGQCLINAHRIFEVVSAPSTAAIWYAFPWSAGIIRPNQIWRLDSYATGTFGGGVGSGYRERFGGSGAPGSGSGLGASCVRP